LTDFEEEKEETKKDKKKEKIVYDDFRSGWAKRTIFTDFFVTWLSPFVEFCKDKTEVKREYLHLLSEKEKAKSIYDKWVTEMKKKGIGVKKTAWDLTIKGMLKYGAMLTFVEFMTIIAIYLVRLIIDYFHL